LVLVELAVQRLAASALTAALRVFLGFLRLAVGTLAVAAQLGRISPE
jgi:hypothetical protein